MKTRFIRSWISSNRKTALQTALVSLVCTFLFLLLFLIPDGLYLNRQVTIETNMGKYDLAFFGFDQAVLNNFKNELSEKGEIVTQSQSQQFTVDGAVLGYDLYENFDPFDTTLQEGRLPSATGEVIVSSDLAGQKDWTVGSTVVSDEGTALTIVGILADGRNWTQIAGIQEGLDYDRIFFLADDPSVVQEYRNLNSMYISIGAYNDYAAVRFRTDQNQNRFFLICQIFCFLLIMIFFIIWQSALKQSYQSTENLLKRLGVNKKQRSTIRFVLFGAGGIAFLALSSLLFWIVFYAAGLLMEKYLHIPSRLCPFYWLPMLLMMAGWILAEGVVWKKKSRPAKIREIASAPQMVSALVSEYGLRKSFIFLVLFSSVLSAAVASWSTSIVSQSLESAKSIDACSLSGSLNYLSEDQVDEVLDLVSRIDSQKSLGDFVSVNGTVQGFNDGEMTMFGRIGQFRLMNQEETDELVDQFGIDPAQVVICDERYDSIKNLTDRSAVLFKSVADSDWNTFQVNGTGIPASVAPEWMAALVGVNTVEMDGEVIPLGTAFLSVEALKNWMSLSGGQVGLNLNIWLTGQEAAENREVLEEIVGKCNDKKTLVINDLAPAAEELRQYAQSFALASVFYLIVLIVLSCLFCALLVRLFMDNTRTAWLLLERIGKPARELRKYFQKILVRTGLIVFVISSIIGLPVLYVISVLNVQGMAAWMVLAVLSVLLMTVCAVRAGTSKIQLKLH